MPFTLFSVWSCAWCIAHLHVVPTPCLSYAKQHRFLLVSMISLCAATSSRVFGLYFSTQGALRPSTVGSVRKREPEPEAMSTVLANPCKFCSTFIGSAILLLLQAIISISYGLDGLIIRFWLVHLPPVQWCWMLRV